MSVFLRQLRTLLRKELRIEWRSRETLVSGGLFSIVVTSIFLFSGFGETQVAALALPGVLWVSLAFVGVVIFTRTFQREREHLAVEPLLLVRGVVLPLFVSKLLANYILLVAIGAPMLALLLTVFRLDVALMFWPSALIMCVGCFGFAVLGSVLSAALSTIDMREVLLPIALFPLCIPLFIAGARALASLTDGGWTDATTEWLTLMGAFDVLFLLIGAWLFGHALDPA